MDTVLISLVGGQVFPVYLGIHQFKASINILIASSQTLEDAQTIIQIAQKEFNSEYKTIIFDPVDHNKIVNAIKKLEKEILDARQILINITGGTKLWSIDFFSIFSHHPNTEIYFIDQNNIFRNLTRNSDFPYQGECDFELICQLNKANVQRYTNLKEYTDNDRIAVKTITEMRDFNCKDFNALTLLNVQKNAELPSGSSLRYDYEEHAFFLTLFNEGIKKTRKLQSKHIHSLLFNAGWFEFKIADLLSHWKYSKEIFLNVEYIYRNKSLKNEVDIIVNTGNRLLFVECKTSIKDKTDIDKFKSVVQNFGGLGCKALFVSNVKLKEEVIEKCNNNNIISFDIESEHLGLSPEKALFMLLEKQLFEINAK